MLGLKLITKIKNKDDKMIDTKQKEIWKVYQELPFIEVSNLGRVKTKDRIVTRGNGGKYFVKGRVLKQHLQPNGYMYVRFRLNGKKVKLYVHRIVATCFIPNPDNYPQVNHKDNDPTNNAVSNLEWCTNQYNQDYKKNFGTSPAQIFGRPVIAVNLETSEIFWFKTQTEAAYQLVANVGHINEVIKGKLHKTGGYWFTYADDTAIEKTRAKFGDEMANKVRELMSDNLYTAY